MHRARTARPPWFDSLPSVGPDCGRRQSSCSAGSSKIKIQTSLAYKTNWANEARILIFDDPTKQEDWHCPQFCFFQVYSMVLVTKFTNLNLVCI
jgi:hypothetical protein